MQLKGSYSAREVSAFTGLSARQLQWWDTHGVFPPAVSPKRTVRGGFTERRYSPLDTLDLLVLAELRRRKYSVDDIRRIIEVLRTRFGARPHETLENTGRMTLLTDGMEIFVRIEDRIFNLLRDPEQPLLVGEERLKPVRIRRHSRKKTT
ncbi:MAG: MerR family transcriptional regulator [Acidobacteriota bacterium]|nr:MerR family transcriptional regulator [Acidobacteriota bacterium]